MAKINFYLKYFYIFLFYLYFLNINKMSEKEFNKLLKKNIKLPVFDIKLLDINILQQFLKQSNNETKF